MRVPGRAAVHIASVPSPQHVYKVLGPHLSLLTPTSPHGFLGTQGLVMLEQQSPAELGLGEAVHVDL